MAFHWGKDTGLGSTGEYSLPWALLEAVISSPRPGPTLQPVSFSAGMPLSKQPTEWEHCPTYQQTGWLMSSWAHRCLLNTPHDMALLTRETRPSSTQQWAGTSLFHQEPCTSTSLSSMGGREQKQEELQPCSLQNRNHNHRGLYPRWRNKIKHLTIPNWSEYLTNPPPKKIQSNDKKDDSRSQKKNGGTDGEDTKMFNKILV